MELLAVVLLLIIWRLVRRIRALKAEKQTLSDKLYVRTRQRDYQTQLLEAALYPNGRPHV